MSEHTPGPWHETIRSHGQSPIYNERAMLIGNITRKEDARLCAAAPDLLAACRATVTEFARLEHLGDLAVPDLPAPQAASLKKLLTQLDAAIKRAAP